MDDANSTNNSTGDGATGVEVKEEIQKSVSRDEKLKMLQEPGWARIKEQFIDFDHKKKIMTEYLPKDTVDELQKFADNKNNSAEPRGEDEPPKKKQKLKGRNKQRPRDQRLKNSEKLCPSIIEERECSFNDRCKFNHKREDYILSKPPDLGDSCYIYETFGKCPYGIACRFGSKHISEDYKNITNKELVEKCKDKPSIYAISRDNQRLLWKKKYDFSKSNKILKDVQKRYNEKWKTQQKAKDEKSSQSNALCDNPSKPVSVNSSEPISDNPVVCSEPNSVKSNSGDLLQNDEHNSCQSEGKSDDLKVNINSSSCSSKSSSNGEGQEKSELPLNQTSEILSVNTDGPSVIQGVDKSASSGALTDEGEIRLRPAEKKTIDFRDKLYLAPLTTVGNLPFRRVVKEYGVDITCSEMAVAINLLQGSQSEWALLKRHPSEDIFGAQLCGSFPDIMTKSAQLLSETLDLDFIDLNLGCPIDFIFKRGEGSAMMGRPGKLGQVIDGMTNITDIPITCKIRTGIFEEKYIAHTLVPKLRDWGVSMTTIHGRSREQRYTKLADWDYVNEVAEAGKPMPIYGNGDILSFEDANLHREQTGVSGLMVARGALIKPWIFTEIKEQRHWDISSSERFDMLKRFANYGLEHWGSDTEGVGKTRRFLLEWLSFLHRYIPVGLLERLPQKINEKPPHYYGRDDMETLMASGNCGDWIKISEMLLGPVPDGFAFLPKHRAASYN